MDVAELLVACTVLVGPERALQTAVEAGWGDRSPARCPTCSARRYAASPGPRPRPRGRAQGASSGRRGRHRHSEVPEIAPLRRVRPRDVADGGPDLRRLPLISQLAADRLRHDRPRAEGGRCAWVVVALILAQCAFVGSGISVRGAVATPLAAPAVRRAPVGDQVHQLDRAELGRSNRDEPALPPADGVPRAQALAAGAVDDVSETMVQMALFLLVLPFVGATWTRANSIRPIPGSSRASPSRSSSASWPSSPCRRCATRSLPGVKSALSGVWSVARDRRKRIELFGGNIALRADLRARARSDLPRVRSPPQPRPARLRQHLGVRPLEPDSGRPEASAPPRRASPPASSRWASTSRRRSPSPSPSASAPSTSRPVWGYFSLRWLGRHGYV